MLLDTDKTIYICTDANNSEVRVLMPHDVKLELVHLNLSDRDPESDDASEHKLLSKAMSEFRFDV